MTTLYDVLGVHRGADASAIKAAFRRLAKSLHPDVNAGDRGATLQFQQVLAAYEVLKNPARRSRYDLWLEVLSTRARMQRRRAVVRWGLITAASAGISLALTMFLPLWESGLESVAFPAPDASVLSADRDPPLRNGATLAGGDVDAFVSLADGIWRKAGQRPRARRQRPAAGAPDTIGERIGGQRDVAARAAPVAAPAVDRTSAPATSEVLAFAADGPPQGLRGAPAPSRLLGIRDALDRPLAAIGETDPDDAVTGQTGGSRPGGWTTYRDDRFAFSLSYPSAFTALSASDEFQRVFRSGDGRARLVVRIRPRSQQSMSSLRQSMINKQYAAASFDYAPVRGNWFVLSGTMGPEMFYERVSLACAGRVVVSWKLTYPIAVREAYDRVVDGIHRRFRYHAGSEVCG